MLTHAPRLLPPPSLILADLGNPPAAELAKTLGVHTRTVERWIAADRMPRSAQLALFWLTRWGRSIVDTCAVNDARLYAGLADAQKREIAELRRKLARLVRLANFGSANDPMAA